MRWKLLSPPDLILLRKRDGVASVPELQKSLASAMNIPYEVWSEVIEDLRESGDIETVLIHPDGSIEVPVMPVPPPVLPPLPIQDEQPMYFGSSGLTSEFFGFEHNS